VTLATVIVRSTAAKIDRMIAVEAAKKLAFIVRAALRNIRRTRTGAALIQGFEATARSFGKILHQLWLEVTGFTFLAIAAIGAITGFREYGKFQSGHTSGPGRLILAICFTASFAWFGLSSFWRVRRRKKA
jgi:hypothetical protein